MFEWINKAAGHYGAHGPSGFGISFLLFLCWVLKLFFPNQIKKNSWE